ncbi:hypothetical protein [Kribbella pratensis]|uniref:Uncharacterized protein n=1 Tax=Kribbella pratensis TaxID=2512112 RepID=A0A4R8CJ43_9ACTN|nr:hypothetical protein [Kribbella pratensis]TDW76256.1 hypothetical protein EV653_1401 [Kribbella pratensis]
MDDFERLRGRLFGIAYLAKAVTKPVDQAAHVRADKLALRGRSCHRSEGCRI